jgi:hypothetical protein
MKVIPKGFSEKLIRGIYFVAVYEWRTPAEGALSESHLKYGRCMSKTAQGLIRLLRTAPEGSQIRILGEGVLR